MSNLMKEVIADARAVREMAVEQAKAALEEAFAPQLDSLISKKLQTEMDDEEDEEKNNDEEEMEVEVDSEETESEETEEVESEEEVEEEEEEIIDEDTDTSGIGTGDNKEASRTSSEQTTEDSEGEVDLQSGHDDAKENSGLTEADDEDYDLEAIVQELEEEAEDDDEEEQLELEMDNEEEEVVDDEEELELEMDDDYVDDTEEEEVVADDDTEEEELELEMDDDEYDDTEEEEEELDLESLVDETEMSIQEELEKLRSENKALKSNLGEHIKAVKYQKRKLNEINILNAKLLFTNKVFGKYTLDDGSKLKIIENFDRAKTVREVKLIYATLMENMQAQTKKPINRTQRLVEGASKAVASTKSSKSIIHHEDKDMKARVHKLMGYKKK